MTLRLPLTRRRGDGNRQSTLAHATPGPGMSPVVDLGQVLEIQVGVDLGRADVRVAEQLLDGAEIAAGFEHMTGE